MQYVQVFVVNFKMSPFPFGSNESEPRKIQKRLVNAIIYKSVYIAWDGIDSIHHGMFGPIFLGVTLGTGASTKVSGMDRQGRNQPLHMSRSIIPRQSCVYRNKVAKHTRKKRMAQRDSHRESPPRSDIWIPEQAMRWQRDAIHKLLLEITEALLTKRTTLVSADWVVTSTT